MNWKIMRNSHTIQYRDMKNIEEQLYMKDGMIDSTTYFIGVLKKRV